jgi:hypothetical protein
MSRMWVLINVAKIRPLTAEERAELQLLLIRSAWQTARILKDENAA